MTRVAVSYRLRRRVRLRSELLPRSRVTVLEHPAGRQEHIAEVFVRAARAARTADSTARGWISAIRQYPSIARRDGYGPIGGTAVKCEGLSPNDSTILKACRPTIFQAKSIAMDAPATGGCSEDALLPV
jgi:hypothetical protein